MADGRGDQSGSYDRAPIDAYPGHYGMHIAVYIDILKPHPQAQCSHAIHIMTNFYYQSIIFVRATE